MAADRAILALARRQHGVVTGGQLARIGVTRGALRHRVHQGWLTRMHRGVYRVGPVAAPRAREMAAFLACGPGAVLSHDTAAALWGIRPEHAGRAHVTLVNRDARHPGITIHRTTDLPPSMRAVRDGLPLTTAARTLADLRLPRRDLERAREQAEILGLVPRAGQHPALTRSEAEARLLDLIRAAHLPTPRTNARLHGYEVDFLWPEQRLVVEVDGFAFHSTRDAFERDRLRDARLLARGYKVMRVTWRQIVEEPVAVVARLAVLLA